jgi:uncharacterized OB-fold protein
MPDTTANSVFRAVPPIRPPSDFFWSSGKDGKLRILRCDVCGTYAHPPVPICSKCQSTKLSPQAVSGRGTVFTYTVNHQKWIPDDDPAPYVIAVVELPEQPALRLMTNLVDCAREDVRIGMAVEVVFEQRGEVWVPLFRPVGG